MKLISQRFVNMLQGKNTQTAIKSLLQRSPCMCVCNCQAQINQNGFSQRQIHYFDVGDARKLSDWNKAVSEAEKIVGYPTSFMSLRCLLSDELSNVAIQMRKLVGTTHPLLKTARRFIWDGKHSLQTRGLMVLLISKAWGPGLQRSEVEKESEHMVSGILPRQRDLAEITEMIYTANLIHKDVVNLDSLSPQDGSFENMHLGNKMATLIGDFLLASASTGLAELRNTFVVENIARALGDLMEANFTPLNDEKEEGLSMEDWRHHSYLASGSLLSRACQSALQLAGHGDEAQQLAYNFGENVAYAYQVKEDLSPLLHPSEDGNGISQVSSPVLLHSSDPRQRQQLADMIKDGQHDHNQMCDLLTSSGAVKQAQELCHQYGSQALATLTDLPPSEARNGLEKMVEAVVAV